MHSFSELDSEELNLHVLQTDLNTEETMPKKHATVWGDRHISGLHCADHLYKASGVTMVTV